MAVKNKIIAGSLTAALATAFIQYHEGTKNYVYVDPVGVKTWCTGETKITLGKPIVVGKTYFSDEECAQILEQSLQQYNKPLEALPYELERGPHIAFLDFTLNTGETTFNKSSMMRDLKAGDVQSACGNLLKYKYSKKIDCSKSSKCKGVWQRRFDEWQVCAKKITVEEFLLRVGKLPKEYADAFED